MNVRLLQLVSPSLPVGAYSYSQGLEAAVEARVVTDAQSAAQWIGDLLALSVASMEAPVLLRLIDAWSREDAPCAKRWNAEFVASRETSELRAETLQMGYSLRTLLRDLDVRGSDVLDAFDELAYPTAFALAVSRWNIEPREAVEAYLFAWIENQALAALKAVPLGQTDGQRMVMSLASRIPAAVD